MTGKRQSSSSANLWRQLEQTALDGLTANEGVLTIDRTDRAQRNLFLSLERLVTVGTVLKVAVGGTHTTYRLPNPVS